MEKVVKHAEFLQRCHWSFFLLIKINDHTGFAFVFWIIPFKIPLTSEGRHASQEKVSTNRKLGENEQDQLFRLAEQKNPKQTPNQTPN